MNSFQTHGIQESRSVANDHDSIEVVLRLRPVAALRNGFRTVRQQGAADQQILHYRMSLEFLKAFVRVHSGIAIIESDDQADRNSPLSHVVNEAAAKLSRA